MALPNSNITTTMVANELGTSSRDVGYLCTHEGINKWSKWKPVRHSTLSGITELELQNTNYGLLAKELPAIVANNMVNGTTGTVIATPVEWEYLKPGTTNPKRLGDFRNYNNQAIPAIADVNNITISDSDIDKYNTNNTDVTWYPSFKFGSQSGDTIGSMTANREIHLYMLEIIVGSQITDGNWRMGLAIWNPSDKMYYIASSPIAFQSGLTGNNIGNVFISLFKESTLVRNLLFNMNENSTLQAIPFLGYKLGKNTSINEFYFMTGASGGRAFNFPEGNLITITRLGFEKDILMDIESIRVGTGMVWLPSTDEIQGGLSRQSITARVSFYATKTTSFSTSNARIQFRKGVTNEWIDITSNIKLDGSSSSVSMTSGNQYTLTGDSDALRTYMNSLPAYSGQPGTGYMSGKVRVIINGKAVGETNDFRYIPIGNPIP